ncbi:MAG TPA: hypothetical protein VH437_20545, partial [Terriglobales bacterium]
SSDNHGKKDPGAERAPEASIYKEPRDHSPMKPWRGEDGGKGHGVWMRVSRRPLTAEHAKNTEQSREAGILFSR